MQFTATLLVKPDQYADTDTHLIMSKTVKTKRLVETFVAALPLLPVQIFGGFADTFGKIRLGGCRLQLGSLTSTYQRL